MRDKLTLYQFSQRMTLGMASPSTRRCYRSRRYWRALSLTRSSLLGRGAVLKALRRANRPLAVAEITRLMNKEAAARAKTVTEVAVARYVEAAISRGEVAVTANGHTLV